MKSRQDAWTHEDDLLLAETVLRHIRDGSTQSAAFEEIGDKLNRTTAACGYRWNTEVRDKFLQAFELAKKQRKETKRSERSSDKRKSPASTFTGNKQVILEESEQEKEKKQIGTTGNTVNSLITIDDCIAFLKNYNQDKPADLKEQNNNLSKENQQLKEENQELTLKYNQLMTRNQNIEHNYKLLMTVLNQVQKTSEKSSGQKHRFH